MLDTTSNPKRRILSGSPDISGCLARRLIASSQGVQVKVVDTRTQSSTILLNFCSNNYLGLSSSHEVIAAARVGLEERGYGMSSVRPICGTQDIHKVLENRIARFVRMDDALVYPTCYSANGGLFEALLTSHDGIAMDELNHPSIVDGTRLCDSKVSVYKHIDMDDLDKKLMRLQYLKRRMIATNGVFSMEGDLAPLDRICDLADKYDALVMVDDSHGTGVVGPTGRGTPEHYGLADRIDLISGTFGKALGGASGGFISGKQDFIDALRQRSRTFLYSNALAPPIVVASIKAIDILSESTVLLDKLIINTKHFRSKITDAGLNVRPGGHPIVPVLLYNARLAQFVAYELHDYGIYVTPISYPTVPIGEARIRVQVSAGHETEHIDKIVRAFIEIGTKYDLLGKTKSEIRSMYGE